MGHKPAKERGELNFIGRTVSYADVNERDRMVYFVRPGETVSKHGDFLLGALLGVALVILWVPLLIIGLVWAAGTDDDSGPLWLAMRGPALAAILLLILMPLLGRRARHADRVARQIADGDVAAVPITKRAKRLAEVARTGRYGYFDYAMLVGKASAMRAQARHLRSLAESADPAITGADYRGRASVLADQLSAAAEQTDDLVDRWIVDPRVGEVRG